jgi:two-component system, cell cycle response regulator
MEHNNLRLESKGKHDLRQLLVVLLGFEGADEERLTRVFQIERRDGRKYTVANPNPSDGARSDILVVNYDNPVALQEKDVILGAHPKTQVVAVSRKPLNEAPAHHIRGILIAARVLSVLDKVIVTSRSETDSAQPQKLVGSLLQQIAEPPEPQVQTATADMPTTAVVTTPDKIPLKPLSEMASTQPQATLSTLLPQREEKPVPQDHTNQTDTVITAEAAKAFDGIGYRVLVVDDSPAIQKSLELNLATLPQIRAIDFADSGEIALEKAEVMQYDLIFLDVMMPGIDGYETCTRLRKKPEFKKTPIIMVSGKTSPLDEVKGIVSGCTTYLTKPVQHEAFQKLSIRVLGWLEKQKKS